MQTRQTQKLDFQDQYFQKFKTRIFSTVHPRRFETLENGSERCKTRSEPASNRLKSGRNKNEKLDVLEIMTFFMLFLISFYSHCTALICGNFRKYL